MINFLKRKFAKAGQRIKQEEIDRAMDEDIALQCGEDPHEKRRIQPSRHWPKPPAIEDQVAAAIQCAKSDWTGECTTENLEVIHRHLRVLAREIDRLTAPPAEDARELAHRNVKINGKTWHLAKTVEECAELIDAITKFWTKNGSEEHIQEEIADVEIALLNLSTIYGRGIIEIAKTDKLVRIERRVLEQEQEAKPDDALHGRK